MERNLVTRRGGGILDVLDTFITLRAKIPWLLVIGLESQGVRKKLVFKQKDLSSHLKENSYFSVPVSLSAGLHDVSPLLPSTLNITPHMLCVMYIDNPKPTTCTSKATKHIIYDHLLRTLQSL